MWVIVVVVILIIAGFIMVGAELEQKEKQRKREEKEMELKYKKTKDLEQIARLLAVQKRIQKKGYPIPKNIAPTNIYCLDDYDIEVAIGQHKAYEKQMDEAAANAEGCG